MSKDTQFRGLLDKLWEKAFQTNFDKESTDRIKVRVSQQSEDTVAISD